jgi:rubrerythrin
MSPAAIHKRTLRDCRRKWKYVSEQDAMVAKARIREEDQPRLGVYVCYHCGYLHLGHEPVWDRADTPPMHPFPRPVFAALGA